MLRVRPDIVRGLIQQLKTELKDVRSIGVYRRNGVGAFADLETLQQVNRRVDLDPALIKSISEMSRSPGPPNNNGLFRRAVETVLPQQTYEMIDGPRVLTLFQPLRNLKECQICHGKDHEVRGVLQISLGLNWMLNLERPKPPNCLSIDDCRRNLTLLVRVVWCPPVARGSGSGSRRRFDARVPVVVKTKSDSRYVINDRPPT
jgi:hypothetical protein